MVSCVFIFFKTVRCHSLVENEGKCNGEAVDSESLRTDRERQNLDVITDSMLSAEASISEKSHAHDNQGGKRDLGGNLDHTVIMKVYS